MPKEKIQKDDTLNSGRKKINKAIDRAYDADDKSSKAIKDSGEALTTSQSVRDELNQVVIDGDSSVEAAQARVGADGTNYSVLKERLDSEHDKVTSQLDQTIQQNRTYIDDQLNKLNGLELKGAYSTLQDLISAYPNGTEGIFLVQENGHWYYWNGSWSDGGLYQALPWDEFMTENNEEWVV